MQSSATVQVKTQFNNPLLIIEFITKTDSKNFIKVSDDHNTYWRTHSFSLHTPTCDVVKFMEFNVNKVRNETLIFQRQKWKKTNINSDQTSSEVKNPHTDSEVI